MFLICSMIVATALIFTYHRRKMIQIQLEAQRLTGQTGTRQTQGIEQEFLVFRESLTAHAMSVDESMKALASRLASLENRTESSETDSQRVGG
jgi:hypothetical protein